MFAGAKASSAWGWRCLCSVLDRIASLTAACSCLRVCREGDPPPAAVRQGEPPAEAARLRRCVLRERGAYAAATHGWDSPLLVCALPSADTTYERPHKKQQQQQAQPTPDHYGRDADPWLARRDEAEEEADAATTPAAAGFRLPSGKLTSGPLIPQRPTVTNYFPRTARTPFPQQQQREQLPQWRPHGGGPRRAPQLALPPGMANLGNTCYMNAVLQARSGRGGSAT